MDSGALQARLAGMGAWGPIAIIAFMATAIVFSPLPSAPIALAAGAVYGHGWGTLYVLLGAELGALVAFGMAGIAPTSFLLARFGSEMASVETDRIVYSTLALGALTVIPIAVKLVRD